MSNRPTPTEEPLAEEIVKEEKQKKHSLIEFLIYGKLKIIHKQQNTTITIVVNMICKTLVLLHVFVTQQLVFHQTCSPFLFSFIEMFLSQAVFYQTIQISLILLKLAIIMSIYLESIQNIQVLGLHWLTKNIVNCLSVVKDLDLLISSFLMFFSWSQNIVIFIISVLINFFHALYLQNYIIRKDIMYISSLTHNLIFISFIVTALSANIILFNLGNTLYFSIFHITLGTIFAIWYYIKGRTLYTHTLMKKSMILAVSFYATLQLVLLQKITLGTASFDLQGFAKYIICIVILYIVFNITFYQPSIFLKESYNGDLKQFQLYIYELLEQSYSSKEAQSMLFGIIIKHLYPECKNQNCPFSRESVFDPVFKIKTDIRQMSQQKDSTVRFYIKCLYKNAFDQRSNDKRFNLQYSEFLYNQAGNSYLLLQQLAKIDTFSLNIMERIYVSKLKLMMEQDNCKLNKDLYEGRLELEHIIESQNHFMNIQKDISQYLSNNMEVWNMFKEEQMELFIIRQKMKKNFKLIQQISKGWKNISRFFYCQKQWKYVYLNYLLFIRNQKIRQKEVDELGSTGSDYADQDNIYFENVNEINNSFVQAILYDEDSFSIKTVLYLNELIVKHVSKNFQQSTQYSFHEIIGSQLSLLMPQEFKDKHSQAVSDWVEQGYIVCEQAYKIRMTKFISKSGNQLPILKHYKSHYHIDQGLQFICLLKINQKVQIQDCQIKMRRGGISDTKKISQMQDIRQFVDADHLTKQFQAQIETNSLSCQKNIFLKQETLMPPRQYKQIQNFKIFSRVFTIFILSSIIILSLSTSSDGNNLNNYGKQFINFMNIYRFPIVLGTNYLKSILAVGNQTKVNSMINSATTNMIYYSSHPLTLKTLYDQDLTVSNQYYPNFANSMTSNISLNQIDLFYTIMASISSLKQLPINRTGKQYQTFSTYLKPSFDNMINGTKLKLHSTFGDIFISMINKQIGFMVSQVIMFTIFVSFLFYYVHSFIKKMNNVLFILTQFNPVDLKKITTYWKQVNKLFKTVFHKMNIHTSRNLSDLAAGRKISKLSKQPVKKNKVTLNKLTKKVSEGKSKKKEELKLRILIIIIMIIFIILALSIEVNMITSINKLYLFQKAGFYFLKFFPAGPIIGLGCMEKYYSTLYPLQIAWNPEKYDDVIASLLIFGQYDYIGEIVDETSEYYKKQKNYFFGNPCAYNPSILTGVGINVAKCESISKGAFKQGLSSFLRYAQKNGELYIRGYQTVNSAWLDEFTLSVTVLSGYVLDALSTWIVQFTSKVQQSQNLNIQLCLIISIVILLLHCITNELLIVGRISKQYKFISSIYQNLVPEFILINEKVVKQKFVIEGFIVNS